MNNDRGENPLHPAASQGQAEICRLIVEIDVELIGKRNEEGETPLFLAALHGNEGAFYSPKGRSSSKATQLLRQTRNRAWGHLILRRLGIRTGHANVGISKANTRNKTWGQLIHRRSRIKANVYVAILIIKGNIFEKKLLVVFVQG